MLLPLLMKSFAESSQFSSNRTLLINSSLVLDVVSDSDCESSCDSESDDSVAEEIQLFPINAEDCMKLYLLSNLPDKLSFEGDHILCDNGYPVRRGNIHRNRELILEWSNTIEDTMFVRQFRLCRADFYSVLQKTSRGEGCAES